MLTLHLFRHGETNFNAEGRVQGQFDSILTENGIAQAEAVRPAVEALQPQSAYSSSNVRARHTAEIITRNLSLDLTLRDDLKEIGMGPMEQILYAELAETHAEHVAAFRERPAEYQLDGAETFQQVQDRGVAAIEDIISAEQSGSVLIVAHGAILKTIFAHYAGVPLNDIWAAPSLHNCCHNIIEVGADGSRRVTHKADKPTDGTIWAG